MTSMTEPDGIDEGLYGEDKPKPESIDQEEAEHPTALLPKSILAGKTFKPGEEVVLKIVAEHGDEIEVEYATEKPDKEESQPKPDMDSELEDMNSSY